MRVAALVLLLAAWGTALWAADARVTVDAAPVLSGPGKARIGELSRDTVVEVVETRDGWMRVRYPGGAGWTPAESLEVQPEPEPVSPPAGAPPQSVLGEEDGYLSRFEGESPISDVDPVSGLARMLAALVIVLGVIGGGVYLARRLLGKRFLPGGRGGPIRVLATRPLGPRSGLVLVEVEGLVWLLSQGPDGAAILTEIRDERALKRLNDRYGFLESAFEARLRTELDLESPPQPPAPDGEPAPGGEATPEQRLAALRRGGRSGEDA